MADIILIAVIALFSYIGAKRGLIRTLVGILSTAVSLFVSMALYRPVAMALSNSPVGDYVREYITKLAAEKTGDMLSIIGNSAIEAPTMLVINIISFAVVVVLTKVIISLVAGIMNVASKLPIIRQANALLGFSAGVISGLLVCYIAIGIIGAFETEESIIAAAQAIKDSLIASSLYEGNIIKEFLS